MTPLSTITGLSAEVADLLAASGIRSTAQLAREDPALLHSRLEMIAWQRGRRSAAPSLDHLEHWISLACMLTPAEEAGALNVEEIPEAVTGPPAGQAWMSPSLRATQSAAGSSNTDTDSGTFRRPSGAAEDIWRKVDPGNFATIDAYNEGRTGVQPLSRDSLAASRDGAEESDRVNEEAASRRAQRIRSKGEELSRWTRRGVVHPRPFHTWCGAFFSLLWRTAFLAGIAGFLYLLLSVERPSEYKTEVIAGFVILTVLGCIQLHFAGRSRCRICSCNLFFSKNCLKNRKAHHIPGFGYVASLSLHLLIFGWFRCMYCGTAVRLRPSRPRRADPE